MKGTGAATARAPARDPFDIEQIAILERIAGGASLHELLDRIVRAIERHSQGLCSILLLDGDQQRVRHGAAPSLPAAFVKAIDGSAIGPEAGSCGTAAYRGERVIVEDIATHPFWKEYKAHALPHGLAACWSSPIFSPSRQVLGTFAVYYPESRGPSPEELYFVDSATHLAAIAISKEQDAEERRRLESQVGLTQRMESLGSLAGGIAHEFNNVLSAVVGNLRLAQEELPPDHPVSARLAVVLDATDRATQLVSQILAFSRRREVTRTPLLLRQVVEEALRLLRATFPAMVEIRTDFSDGDATVLADASQIHQIVLNLGTNALHAMGSRGVFRVRIHRVELKSPLSGVSCTVPAGRYVKLQVSDTGSGIESANVAHIFDPFYTTKEPGVGTGLGLPVVLGIVAAHGGTLTVRSAPHSGTVFEVYFPESDKEHQTPRRETPSAVATAAGRRVLCVDDEPAIISLQRHMLGARGFVVEGFTDPGAAVARFLENPSHFDAVVTDFAMSEMTGTELAERVLRVRPDLPIIMTSGYLRPEEEALAKQVGVRVVLTKPRFLQALAETLTRLC